MRKSATDGYDVTVRHEQYISVNCLRRAISIGERGRTELKSGTLLGWYGWVMDLGGDTLELACLSNVLGLPMPETPKVIAKVRTEGGRQYGYYGHA